MKLAGMLISGDLLLEEMKKYTDDIPKDAKLLCVERAVFYGQNDNHFTSNVRILMQSDEFDDLPEGSAIPNIDPIFKTF